MPVYAFVGARKEFLDTKKTYYNESYAVGDAKNALANILRLFCRLFPLSKPTDWEPTPEEFALALEDKQLPDDPELDQASFTEEEWQKVLKDRALEQAALLKLQGQLQRWFSYRYIKANGLLKLNTTNLQNHPLSRLFRNLEGTDKKPRLRSALNVWRQGYSKAVEEEARRVVEQEGSSVSRGLVGVRATVAKEMFDALSREDRDHYQMLAKEEHKNSLAAYEANKLSGPSTTPEARQSSINSLSRVVQPLLDAIVEATGWRVSLIAGGPEPVKDGQMSILMLHSGTTLGDVKMDWGRFEHRRIPEIVMPMFGDYLRKCYSVSECHGRTLGEESTPVPAPLPTPPNPPVPASSPTPPIPPIPASPLTPPTCPVPAPSSTPPISPTPALPSTLPTPVSASPSIPPTRPVPAPSPPISPLPAPPSTPPTPVAHQTLAHQSPGRLSRSPSPPFHSRPSSPRYSCSPSPHPSSPPDISLSQQLASIVPPPRSPSPADPTPEFGSQTAAQKILSSVLFTENTGEKRTTVDEAPGEESGRGRKRRKTRDVGANQQRSTQDSLVSMGVTPASDAPPSRSSTNALIPPTTRQSTRIAVVASSSTIASPTAIPSEVLAPWFIEAMDLFVKGSVGIGPDNVGLGSRWVACLEAYSLFQRKHGFGEGIDTRLPTTFRPLLVKDWISRGRTRNKLWRPKDFVPKDFKVEFAAWWTSLQPSWRVKNGAILVDQVDGDWSQLAYPGVNGLLSVMAALFFWGLESQDKAWCAAVDDCTTALAKLASIAGC